MAAEARLNILQHLMIRSRNRYFFILDAILFPIALIAGYVARFEGWSWLATETRVAGVYLLVSLPVKMLVLFSLGMYRRLWRYASVAEVERIVAACGLAALCGLLLGAGLLPALGAIPHRVPYAVLLAEGLLSVVFVASTRLSLRVQSRWSRKRMAGVRTRRVLVAGAGAAGGMIVKELLGNPQLGLTPVGFLDDDRSKHGNRLHSVPVLGRLSDLPRIAAATAAEELIIALPSATGRVIRELVGVAQTVAIPTRTVPGVYEIISGQKSVSKLRPVEIQDLLRREPITTDLEQVRSLCTGETVLVTGAGGSIGSELCRQLATLDPARIVAVGRGENSIFELVQELTASFPNVTVDPVIADVRDRARLERVFRQFKPFTVFHAAAHKHVPLMEQNVAEAVINNVLGTRNVATLSAEFEVEHFVLISTDKAVRPTSVMGATKRIAEGVVHAVAAATGKNFVSVRFGNVLGSRGSVVPTFLRQIARGGPVTVTHPEMRRYFMTIPEAVQLVMQAGAMGRGCETFVLDMGEPVRVQDLAADLIRLSGLQVGTDVEIQFTGARPGEKLYEELFFSAENAEPTQHAKVLRGRNIASYDCAGEQIEELIKAALGNASNAELRAMIKWLVPEYETPRHAELPAVAAAAAPAETAPAGRAGITESVGGPRASRLG